jgi:AcrR family transcriptional regulator
LDLETARARVLDAAGELFYGRGVQAVGMDEIRSASGVSLKRLYQLFPSKGDLVQAYLRRRDARWRAALAGYVDARPAAVRVLAVFDCLTQAGIAPAPRRSGPTRKQFPHDSAHMPTDQRG